MRPLITQKPASLAPLPKLSRGQHRLTDAARLVPSGPKAVELPKNRLLRKARLYGVYYRREITKKLTFALAAAFPALKWLAPFLPTPGLTKNKAPKMPRLQEKWMLRHELGHAISNVLVDEPVVWIKLNRKSTALNRWETFLNKLSGRKGLVYKTDQKPKTLTDLSQGNCYTFIKQPDTYQELKHWWLVTLGGLVATHGVGMLPQQEAKANVPDKLSGTISLEKRLHRGAALDMKLAYFHAMVFEEVRKQIANTPTRQHLLKPLANYPYIDYELLKESGAGLALAKKLHQQDETLVTNALVIPAFWEAFETLSSVLQKIPDKAWTQLEADLKKTGYKIGPKRIRHWIEKTLRDNDVDIAALKLQLKEFKEKA